MKHLPMLLGGQKNMKILIDMNLSPDWVKVSNRTKLITQRVGLKSLTSKELVNN